MIESENGYLQANFHQLKEKVSDINRRTSGHTIWLFILSNIIFWIFIFFLLINKHHHNTIENLISKEKIHCSLADHGTHWKHER